MYNIMVNDFVDSIAEALDRAPIYDRGVSLYIIDRFHNFEHGVCPETLKQLPGHGVVRGLGAETQFVHELRMDVDFIRSMSVDLHRLVMNNDIAAILVGEALSKLSRSIGSYPLSSYLEALPDRSVDLRNFEYRGDTSGYPLGLLPSLPSLVRGTLGLLSRFGASGVIRCRSGCIMFCRVKQSGRLMRLRDAIVTLRDFVEVRHYVPFRKGFMSADEFEIVEVLHDLTGLDVSAELDYLFTGITNIEDFGGHYG